MEKILELAKKFDIDINVHDGKQFYSFSKEYKQDAPDDFEKNLNIVFSEINEIISSIDEMKFFIHHIDIDGMKRTTNAIRINLIIGIAPF